MGERVGLVVAGWIMMILVPLVAVVMIVSWIRQAQIENRELHVYEADVSDSATYHSDTSVSQPEETPTTGGDAKQTGISIGMFSYDGGLFVGTTVLIVLLVFVVVPHGGMILIGLGQYRGGYSGHLSHDIAHPKRSDIYYEYTDLRQCAADEVVTISQHNITKTFPAWLAATMTFLTGGGRHIRNLQTVHGALPKINPSDYGLGKAYGFLFIPFFGLYWIVACSLKAMQRVNLQLRLRGIAKTTNDGMLIGGWVGCLVLPTVGQILLTINAYQLQHSINQLAGTSPQDEGKMGVKRHWE